MSRQGFPLAPFVAQDAAMRVAIIGATGFVGGYLVEAVIANGYEPSVLVRPGSHGKLRCADQCHIVTGQMSVVDLQNVLKDCEAVIYNVGILREFPKQGITFEAAQYQGVVNTLEAAQRTDVRRMLLMSANGIKQPGVAYQETKLRAELALKDSGLAYTIFRPSVIFGDPRGGMEFATQLYRDMVRPPVPAIAFHTGYKPAQGQVLMSPVHVADVATAFAAALDNEDTIDQTYTLGGPNTLSWTDMLRCIASACGKKKLILPMPISVMQLAATLLDRLPFFPVTRDQLTMLAEGNTASPDDLQQLIGRQACEFTADNLSYLSNQGE